VEELIEKEDAVDTTPATDTPELVEEVLPETEAVETPISEIVEEEKLEELGIEKTAKAKSILASIVKFDKAQYEAAREALANLIAIEAGEMKEGHNEIMSISHLLEAVAHLAMWYEGEEAEGEVVEEIQEAAKAAEETPEDEDAEEKMCKECKKSMKECACDKGAEPDPVPTAETGANLDTATIVPPSSAPKSVSVDETEVNALVEQVVKSATESLKAEIESLVAAKEAALEKSVSLEAELATAKSLAVAGGPKRTGTSLAQDNDLLVKAATYKAKANATTDPVLVKGYMELAKEFYAKAEETLNK
jgi:transcription termination factor NusB